MRRFWPATLAGRTALVLILALMAVQAAGLLPRGAVRAVSKARGGLERSLKTAAGWRP